MRSIPLATLALTCLAALGCRPGSAGEDAEVVPELVMQGVRFRVERGGVTTARGTAEVVTYRRDTTAVAARDLALTLLGTDGEVLVTAPAASGVVADRVFQAAGGLVALRGSDRATSDAARYQPSAEGRGGGLVLGDRPVLVTGPGYQLTGRAFVLDPATRLLSLTGGARLVSGLAGGR